MLLSALDAVVREEFCILLDPFLDAFLKLKLSIS